MPIYVYEEILPDGEGGEQYEIFQKMSDGVLEVHPENGKSIRRILAVPSIGGIWSDSHASKSLSDQKLKEKGFTKYVKSGDGTYEKVIGKGPNSISRDAQGVWRGQKEIRFTAHGNVIEEPTFKRS